MAEYANGLQHLAGIGEVRAAVPWVRSGAQTPLESLSRVRLMRCGLPEPRLQVPFYDDEGLIGIVDMYWDELGVIGEADGLLKYRTGADLIAEKYREDRLRRKKPVVGGTGRRCGTRHGLSRSGSGPRPGHVVRPDDRQAPERPPGQIGEERPRGGLDRRLVPDSGTNG